MKEKTYAQNDAKLYLLYAGACVAALAGSALIAKTGGGAYVLIGIAALAAGLKYPEAVFALFLTAGFYKSDPRFQLPGVDLTVALGVLSFLGTAYGVRRGRIKLEMPPMRMFLPYLVILWLGALSLMYTEAPVYGKDKLVRLLTITAVSFLAPYYLFYDGKRLKHFYTALVAVAAVMLYDVLGKADMSTKAAGDVSAFGSDYLALGYIEGAAFLLVFVFFLQTGRSFIGKSFYVLVLCPAIIYTIMVSGARGPLFSLVLGLMAVFFLARRPHREARRLSRWVLAVFLLSAVYFYFNLSDFTRMSARLDILGQGGGDSAMERVELARAAVGALGSLPTLFTGLGLGGFSVLYRGYDDVRGSYPHNIFLEMGVELGLAGAAAMVLLAAMGFGTLRRMLKSARGEPYFHAAAMLAFFVFTLFNALKSGDINDNRLFFTSVGMIYALGRSGADEKG